MSFFYDTPPTTEIYTLSLHDALPIFSGLDAQEKAWTVADRGIALTRLGRCDVEKMDDVGMDLFKRNELQVGRAEGELEAAAVFEDVVLGVPFGEAEIENSFAALTADTAGRGAEAVDEPGQLC